VTLTFEKERPDDSCKLLEIDKMTVSKQGSGQCVTLKLDKTDVPAAASSPELGLTLSKQGNNQRVAVNKKKRPDDSCKPP